MNKNELIKLIKDNTNKLIEDNSEQKKQIKGVYNHIYDKINDLTKDELQKYLDDEELSFYCVNEDYFMIYYSNCNKFIGSQFFNMFNLLNELDDIGGIEYMFKKDKNNYSNLNSEKFVNMYAYVIGSHILEYK
tara:strand:+ start:98 stop:496 length:399 start_codon:yes stop_codon:yes gene_type:complete